MKSKADGVQYKGVRQMTEEERNEQIKLVKITGIVIMVIMGLLSASMIILGMSISKAGERRFTLLMISAGAGILTVILSGLTFLRIDRIKSRGALMTGGACTLVSIAVMLATALVSLLAQN